MSRGIFATKTLTRPTFLVENPFVIRLVVPQVKWFSDAPQLSAAELEERALEVIKSFDKVEPEKVSQLHYVSRD